MKIFGQIPGIECWDGPHDVVYGEKKIAAMGIHRGYQWEISVKYGETPELEIWIPESKYSMVRWVPNEYYPNEEEKFLASYMMSHLDWPWKGGIEEPIYVLDGKVFVSLNYWPDGEDFWNYQKVLKNIEETINLLEDSWEEA